MLRIAGLFNQTQRDEEFAAELESHLAMHIDDGVRSGLSPAQARRHALLKLGGVEYTKESYRERRGLPLLESLLQDLRYACRLLRKAPGFTAAALLSLALGIGGTTAIFSVVHAVLLRPLPYPHPERLVRVGHGPEGGDVGIPQYEFWKQHAQSFAFASAWRGRGQVRLVTPSRDQWVAATSVSADFLGTLQVRPALGREFNADETRAGGPLAIMLSDAIWRKMFDSDPNLLGRAIELDEITYRIVGVLPKGFWFPTSPDVLVPLQPSGTVSDTGYNTGMVARLAPGVSPRQVQAEMPVVAESFQRAHPDITREYRGLSAMPFQEWLSGDVRLILLLLLGAAGFLLLIACCNVSGLLLSRLFVREREIAVRIALGSGRGRLLRQFLMENLLLSMIGGSLGVAAAYASLRAFVASIPFSLPASAPISIDTPVLLFSSGAALLTGLILGLAPVIGWRRSNLLGPLTAGRPAGTTAMHQRARSLLVIAEVALSVSLLVVAVLLTQSLYHLRQEPLGFRTRGLITFRISPLKDRRSDRVQFQAFNAALDQRLRAVPGVRRVASVNMLPFSGPNNFPTQHENHPEHSIGGMEIRIVTPSYFETMGIPVRRGRSLSRADTASSKPVVLINETVARRWWPAQDPLNDRIVYGQFKGRNLGGDPVPPFEVVGVVADAKSLFLKQPPSPTIYIPAAQAFWYTGAMSWIIQSDNVNGSLLRQAVADLDPSQRVDNVRPMDEIVAATTADTRFDALLLATLALLAVTLTAIGVYGVLSFVVSRRTNEIGVRMALGADSHDVLRLVVGQGLLVGFAGLIVGLGTALALSRIFTTLLFGVRPNDPLTFLAVSSLLLAITLTASYLPARRAMRIDPAAALRRD
jgi:putative ABC transport system permease protein